MLKDFHHPLDPSETMTIRRIVTPPRVPNKGNAVYCFHPMHGPFLEANGWAFVARNKRDRLKAYFRSPVGAAESFILHIAIPTDEPLLRLAAEMIRFVTRPPGPGDTSFCRGALGPYLASFYGCGRRFLSDNWSLDYPAAHRSDRRGSLPSLTIHPALGLSPRRYSRRPPQGDKEIANRFDISRTSVRRLAV